MVGRRGERGARARDADRPVARAAAVAVTAPYYWPRGDGAQLGVGGVDLTELAADGDGAAGRNAGPARTEVGGRPEAANGYEVAAGTRPVNDVVAKAAAVLEARDGAGDGMDQVLRRHRLKVKLRLLRSKLVSGPETRIGGRE